MCQRRRTQDTAIYAIEFAAAAVSAGIGWRVLKRIDRNRRQLDTINKVLTGVLSAAGDDIAQRRRRRDLG